MTIWMKVTKDDLELPIAIADTAVELAKICGTSPNNIVSQVSKFENHFVKSTSYRKVVIDGED